PVIMQPLAHERLLGRGAAPEVIVDRGRDLLRPIDLADAAAPLVAKATGEFDLAELARVEEGHGLAHAGAAAALCTRLANTAGGASSFDNTPALAHVVADGLFDINVLAGLEGPDGRQGVPVVGRGDADGVDGLVLEDLAKVGL